MQITRRKFIANGVLMTGGAIFTDSFWVERYFIETNEFYFGTATKNTNNLKMVQISDLHLHGITYQIKELANQLNKLQPDLILITGDAIDKSLNMGLLKQFLQLIDNKIKKVAVLGNWEYQAEINFVALEDISYDGYMAPVR